MIGSRPLLQVGTATAAKSGSTVTVEVDGETITVECARDLTVAAGDPVLIGRVVSKPFVICRLFPSAVATIPPVANPSPPAKPTTVYGTLVIQPVSTGSYRTLGWRSDSQVRQGEYGGSGNHTGAVFYGAKPSSLAGATATFAYIELRRARSGPAGDTPTTLHLVTETTRPAGAPTLTLSTDGPSLRPGEHEQFAFPLTWAQALVDGTAGGLALYDADGSPYVEYDGAAVWSPAFSLTIEWQR